MQQALPHQQQWLSLAQLSPGWAAVLVVACVVTLTSRHSCINTLYLASAWVRLQDTEQHLQAEERELLNTPKNAHARCAPHQAAHVTCPRQWHTSLS